MSVEDFVTRSRKLLEKERDAEIEETRVLTEQLPAKELQRRGVCLIKLRLAERGTGLYGRTVVTFQPYWPGKDLPSHNFTPGDIVGVAEEGAQSDSQVSGVVSRVLPTSLQVAFEENEDVFSLDDDKQFRLTKLANDVTYRRLKRALSDLEHYSSGPCQQLINILFGLSPLTPPALQKDYHWINTGLDDSQKEAVKFALAQQEVAVIHGPPGTGKTTTVVELILQAVHQGIKVLALAPSNVAVDNMVERLGVRHKRIVRIGHPARLLPHIAPFALDAMVSANDQTALAADARRDLSNLLGQLKGKRGQSRSGIREEMKQLRREVRQREEAATREILSHADVVLVTLTSASADSPLKLLEENHFELVVIDECSQALEAACWMGLLHGRRCVLAGDPHQLPPTILSKQAAAEGLGVTLMERVMEAHGDKVVRMLTTQYRMHRHIMQWSSQQLYHNRLQAHPSVAAHLLSDLSHVEEGETTSTPLLLVDTAGCHMTELDLPHEVSKGNEGEADIVAAHVEQLVKAGISPQDIAVIAPYNLQVELLRQRLSAQYPGLEIKSVDGFQGREKEAVVISFVRSNDKREVGFLSDKRRINVAVTRARRHLAVICDSDTVNADPFLRSLLDYMSSTGQVWSAHQFIQEGLVTECSTRPERLDNLLSEGATAPAGQKPRKERAASGAGRGKGKRGKGDQQKQDAAKHPPPGAPQREQGGRGDKQLMPTEEKQEIYEKMLGDFVADTAQTSITFPSTLTSHDRMVIHEVSEKLGLLHMSQGEGKDRHLVVSKPGATVPEPHSAPGDPDTTAAREAGAGQGTLTEGSDGARSDLRDDQVAEDAEESAVKVTKTGEEKPGKPQSCCRLCGRDVIPSNLLLHEAHCSKKDRQPSRPSSAAVKKEKKEKKKKTPTQLDQAAEVLGKVADDDFDALIASVTALDSQCSFKKCRVLTNTLGRNCQHCTRRFCLQHLMPEVHGCGEAAKVHARQTISREGVLHRGSGVPSKKPSADKRALLERKLNKKLSEMNDQRSRKDPKKDGGQN
ncbi:DNA-binding protein SMUBP-2-like isoform X2 [Babylonia areolata]|uniref:DNA-binding protein SMUBP-2-like isoform X2 n=1 Tax=Babylonia areolata TaxID=304850 RepID=UPI003FCF0BDC